MVVCIIVASGARRRSDLCLRPKRGIRVFGRVLITDRGWLARNGQNGPGTQRLEWILNLLKEG